MTQDQARAHLEGMRNLKAGQADSLRKLGEDYRLSACAADNADLRRANFESSSRLFADARGLDFDVEAIDIVLGERS